VHAHTRTSLPTLTGGGGVGQLAPVGLKTSSGPFRGSTHPTSCLSEQGLQHWYSSHMKSRTLTCAPPEDSRFCGRRSSSSRELFDSHNQAKA
jgi:hypothetical protein